MNNVFEGFLTWVLSKMLSLPQTRSWVLTIADRWSDVTAHPGMAYRVSSNLQQRIAQVTGWQICEYCQWAVKHGEAHGWCNANVKVNLMGDVALKKAWEALPTDYDPDAYFDEELGITMQEWAEAISSEIAKRDLEVQVYDDWLQGAFVTCPHCLEQYWSEDGHPPGTTCPVFGDLEPPPANPKFEAGWAVCQIHGKRYWSEDMCPDCEG